MTCSQRVPFLVLLSFGFVTLSASASAQDECSTATPIPTDGTVIFSSLGGATASPEPHCFSASPVVDLWYSFTPAESGRAVLTIEDPGAFLGVAAEVYEGPCESLTPLACLVAGFPLPSTSATVNVVAGRTYFYRQLLWEASGVNLSVTLTPDISDDCIGAFNLLEDEPFAFDTTAATASAPDFSCGEAGSTPTSPDLWFTFTAGSDGQFSASTCGTADFDTRIEVYSADPFSGLCPSAVSVACNDDGAGCANGASEALFSGVAGNTFLVRVGGVDDLSTGTGTIVVTRVATAPMNDECADALPVIAGTTTFSSNGATDSGITMGCAPAGDGGSSADVWFEYTSRASCLVQFDTLGSDYDTIVSLHRTCNGLNEVACGDDFDMTPQGGTTYFAEAGFPYKIQVGSVAGATGNGVLNITEMPAGIAELFCVGVPNSTGRPSSICALGSPVATDNDLSFEFRDLPATATCLLVNSMSATLIPNAGGSVGNLCIGSLAMGRQALFSSDVVGAASFTLDLTMTPTNVDTRAIVAGETWYWQVWHRDMDPMTSTLISNFSNAIELTFE